MLKINVTLLFVVLFLVTSSSAFAGGGCPRVASQLSDFAYCMRDLPDGQGVAYKGTLANLEAGDDNVELLNALHSSVRPTHYVPSHTIPAGVWAPAVSVAASKAYSGNAHATFWTWYTLHNMGMYPR